MITVKFTFIGMCDDYAIMGLRIVLLFFYLTEWVIV